VLSVFVVGQEAIPREAWGWPLFLVALLGGWLVTFLANVLIGTLSLFMESSQRVMDVWLALFFVFSGYLYPVELFPPALRAVSEWLPFRYQIGLPVETLTGAHGLGETLGLLARQWLWVAALLGASVFFWKRGLKRFGAFGG